MAEASNALTRDGGSKPVAWSAALPGRCINNIRLAHVPITTPAVLMCVNECCSMRGACWVLHHACVEGSRVNHAGGLPAYLVGTHGCTVSQPLRGSLSAPACMG